MILCDKCGKPIDIASGYYTATVNVMMAGEVPTIYQFHKDCLKAIATSTTV
jgi:hypothetical protein